MNVLEKYAHSFFYPRPDLTVTEWCEANLQLDRRVTETPGPFSIELFPFAREPLETFRDRSTTDICLVWGSQTSKTTILYCGLAWAVDQNPQPALYSLSSENVARSFSKNRWMPLVENSPALARHKPADSDYFQVLEQQFDGMTVRLIGSNSAGNASSTPISLAIQDEIDKYPTSNAKEAGTVELIDERTKSYMSAKRYKSSTPTTESGAIWREWKKSDQRYFFFPCPHCAASIRFQKDMVAWDQDACNEQGEWDTRRVKESARCNCPECGGQIQDADKTRILEQGEWRPTNLKADPARRGYHLNSLYSPRITFGQFAVKWVTDSRDPETLRNLINSWLAEPWKEKVIEAKTSLLEKCEGDYDRGDKMGRVRIMTVDTQRTDFAYNVRGYNDRGSYLIDHGRVPTEQDLDTLQDKHDCEWVFVDTGGDRTQEIYEIIHERRARNWIAIKGVDSMELPFHAKKIDPFVGKKRQGRIVLNGITFLTVNTNVWRGELARRRIGRVPSWQVYRNPHTGYVRELFSEYQRETITKGKRKVEWVKKNDANHQFDLEVYQLCASRWLKIAGPKARQQPDHTEEETEDEPQDSIDKPDTIDNKEKKPAPAFVYRPMSSRGPTRTVI